MAPYYDNPGQINDEALNIAGGRTYQVIQLADSEGNVIDPSTGSIEVDGIDLTTIEEGLASIDSKLPELLDGAQPTGVPARTPTTTSVASSATSVLILASNANRKGLSIANNSTSVLRLAFNVAATTANAFIVLQPKSFILLDQQLIVTNAIYGIWESANGTAQVTEFV